MAINNINNSNYFESDDYINFANWVAREIFEIDGNWNNDYFKEIACRKLYKLGIINNNNKTWEYETGIKTLEQNTISEKIYTEEYFAKKDAEQKLYELQQNVSDDYVNKEQVEKIVLNWYFDVIEGKETKGIINLLDTLPPVIPTHGTCKDCKHWKDSDGVYRRGVGAESKCPINIKEVYEGTFYCADFEKAR